EMRGPPRTPRRGRLAPAGRRRGSSMAAAPALPWAEGVFATRGDDVAAAPMAPPAAISSRRDTPFATTRPCSASERDCDLFIVTSLAAAPLPRSHGTKPLVRLGPGLDHG